MTTSEVTSETSHAVPAYSLYGETESSVPSLHLERISDRAPLNGWKIKLHRHPALTQFLVVLEGTFEAIIGAKIHTLSGPALIGVPAGKAHAFNFEKGTCGFVLSLRDVDRGSHPGNAPAVLTDSVIGPCCDDVLNACQQLHGIQGRSSQAHRELKDALVSQIRAHAHIMLEESGAGASRSPSHQLVKRFRESVEERLQNRWSVAQHADALCVTATHLNRVIKSATGMTASQLIAEATLERAKTLLLHTNRSVAEVAFALGYDDPPHFSRRFRSWTGHSPRDWRMIDLQHSAANR